MDKMTINMIAGAVLSSLLVIFGTNTLIDIVYPRGGAPEARAPRYLFRSLDAKVIATSRIIQRNMAQLKRA